MVGRWNVLLGWHIFRGYLVSRRVSCFPFLQQSCKWKMTIFCFRCWRCCWMMAAIQSNISWCNNSLGFKQYNLHKRAILIETNIIVPPNVISMKFDAWKVKDVDGFEWWYTVVDSSSTSHPGDLNDWYVHSAYLPSTGTLFKFCPSISSIRNKHVSGLRGVTLNSYLYIVSSDVQVISMSHN